MIDLDRLQGAAERFANYEAKIKAIDESSSQLKKETENVSRRHREDFLPPSERLVQMQRAVSRTVEPAVAELIPPVETVISIPLLDGNRALTITDGLIPEVMVRDNDLRPMRFLHIATLAGRAVGRIRISDSPDIEGGDATGFLVAPGLLITNYHVLKSVDFASAASIIFDDEDGLDGAPLEQKVFRLRPDLVFVNDKELDYAIVAVSNQTASGSPLAQFGYLRLFKQTGKLDPTQREAANIIQHPGGGPKKIAVRDSYILKVLPDTIDPKRQLNSLFYGTDTLKGSSGAPVCSDQWYVVALHRGGVPETKMVDGKLVVMRVDGKPAVESDSRNSIHYLTNEGTRISRIYRSLEKKAKKDTHASIALEKITSVSQDPKSGPISLRTSPIQLPLLATASQGGAEEIIRRKASKFEGAKGYRPSFLGAAFRVPLPQMTSEVERELATLKNSTSTELKYANYSIKINRERRTAVFAAGNIDGSKMWKNHPGNGALPKRPAWSFDPRMDEAFQPDDLIFSTAMQRGHLFKREDAVWGADPDAMKLADEHSFTIPNATPMIANFNNVEWGDLEDIVSDESQAGNKVSYFAGPIFRSTDRFFNEFLRVKPEDVRKGMRVPESFWKIVFWAEAGSLRAAGFILRQTDEIEAAGPLEEINFGTYQKTPITQIEQETGLRFPRLVLSDTFQNQ